MDHRIYFGPKATWAAWHPRQSDTPTGVRRGCLAGLPLGPCSTIVRIIWNMSLGVSHLKLQPALPIMSKVSKSKLSTPAGHIEQNRWTAGDLKRVFKGCKAVA